MVTRRIAVAGLLLLLACEPAAYADSITLTGGSITTTALAGGTAGGDVSPPYQQNTDTPAALTPQWGTPTSLTASATGQSPSIDVPAGPMTVTSSATGGVDIEGNPMGASVWTVTSNSTATLAHYGPGLYCCAQSSATDTVNFAVTGTEGGSLDWSVPQTYSSSFGESATLTDTDTNAVVFHIGGAQADYKANFTLAAGDYQLLVESASGTYPGPDDGGTLTMDVSPVPLPPTAWLLGSALLVLFALRRRAGPPARIAG